MNDIGYSGQYLDNHGFKIKVCTGTDIHNATGNAVAGEIFLVTGASPALYVATETSTDQTSSIYKIADLTNQVT